MVTGAHLQGPPLQESPSLHPLWSGTSSWQHLCESWLVPSTSSGSDGAASGQNIKIVPRLKLQAAHFSSPDQRQTPVVILEGALGASGRVSECL